MKLGQRLYNSIFPPPFDLKPKEQQLLEKMYPNIDWNYVQCYNGMPWYMHFTFAIGTALPHTYNSSRVNIYFRDPSELSIYQRSLLLVHEAFHIQQYQELNSMAASSSGWGFNRRFMRYYLSWYFQSLYKGLFKDKLGWKKAKYAAYRQHPMEIPAYNHEAAFEQNMDQYRGHSVSNFLGQIPQLVVTNAQLPQAPSFIFALMGGLLSLFISLIKPFLEGILILIALVLGGRKPK